MRRIGAGSALAAMVLAVAGIGSAADAGGVDDDHGDSVEMATLLPIGPPRSGVLSDDEDVDVFRLDIAGAARVEVRSSGRTDIRGELLDGTGARLASDDDGGPGGHNFSIEADLRAGVYYVLVTGSGGASGDYSVTARLADALDQGDTAATSTLLTLQGEEDLADVSVDILLGNSGRIWPSTEDVDVFRFDVPHDATDVTVRTSGAELHARLVDSSLADVAVDDDIGNVRLEARLDAGAYYVVIGGHEVGGYRVLAQGDPTGCPCARPATVRDDGSSFESSTLLAVGGPPAAGAIADDTDVDVFRLDLAGSAGVEVLTSGRTDTRAELLDGDGALIASDDDSGPGGHNFRIEETLAAGVYYVVVRGAAESAGEYAVTARLGGARDHGDTEATSTLLRVYGEEDLARVMPDILLGTSGRIWPSAADVDVFRLDVARDGTQTTVRSGGTALHGRLLDSSLADVAADLDGGNVRLEAALDAGIYYVLIGGHQSGNYRVLASGDADRPCPCADGGADESDDESDDEGDDEVGDEGADGGAGEGRDEGGDEVGDEGGDEVGDEGGDEVGDEVGDEGDDGSEEEPPVATARYAVTFTAQWTDDLGQVPGGAHFTTLAGAAVNADADLWTPGQLASPGLERLAELGQTSTFLAEIRAATEAGDAAAGVTSRGTRATGTSVFELTVSRDLPNFTFASMVAPSPDWFVGLAEFPLLDGEGRWVEDTGAMGLPAWDAGTETGNRFSLGGSATVPPQAIRLLTENVSNGVVFVSGTVNGNYLATIRFLRIP